MFKDFAKNNIVLFDGAMGTAIQKTDIDDNVWAGKQGCNEFLNIVKPEIIENIHKCYFESGANIAVTNTFGAIRSVLAEYGLEDMVADINKRAVDIAKKSTENKPNRFIGLSIGPGTKLASLCHTTYDDLYTQYKEQVESGFDVDFFMIETAQDIMQVKAAINACTHTNKKYGKDKPILVSFTVEDNDCLLAGSDLATVATVMAGYDIFALGLNCALGPDAMVKPLSKLASVWGGRLYLSSNAGIPEIVGDNTIYKMNADTFAKIHSDILNQFHVSLIGGCCGTDYSHITALSEIIKGKQLPKIPKIDYEGKVASLFNSVSLDQTPKPAIIGERANATGSKAFKEMLLSDDIDSMISLCVTQEEEGAHYIDLSTAYAGRKEVEDYVKLVPMLNLKLTAPLVIDSTDTDVILQSVKRYTGKPIINSINFEDGGKKLRQILNIVKDHPASVIALTIDESGMAQSAEEKFNIAKRLYDTFVHEYKFKAEDLIIDPLTFSIGSGDKMLEKAALETIEAIKRIKKELKGVKTVLGVSNISFGLAPKMRVILNSVFLHVAVKAGLDVAIVHSSKLIDISKLSTDDFKCCMDLINGESNSIQKFIDHFSQSDLSSDVSSVKLTPLEVLPLKIRKGDKAGISELLNDILLDKSPEEIINDILFPAMQEVGERFGRGEMLLPFVLQSAEAMRYSVQLLEPKLKKESVEQKGKIVLATVLGDVHDIGKNLVDIILSNNGFNVYNLGIKVPVADMIAKAKEINADAIGMSGLLVKSTLIMRDNIKEIAKELPNVKILLGGAALTSKFVNNDCANLMPDKVYYCKDAFDDIKAMSGDIPTAKAENLSIEKNCKVATLNNIEIADVIPPKPSFFGVKKLVDISIDEVFNYLDEKWLFRTAWGYKKGSLTDIEYENMLKDIAYPELKRFKDEIKSANILELKAQYGYFLVKREDNQLALYIDKNDILLTLNFPTSDVKSYKSLATFFNKDSEDIMPIQIVTIGDKAISYCKKLFNKHEYKEYYMANGFFTAVTEALAELVHHKIRKELSLKGSDKLSDILKKDYEGGRFSCGYPLTPAIDNNIGIANILKASEIGIIVNENFQMEPEYSTSAFILHKNFIK